MDVYSSEDFGRQSTIKRGGGDWSEPYWYSGDPTTGLADHLSNWRLKGDGEGRRIGGFIARLKECQEEEGGRGINQN